MGPEVSDFGIQGLGFVHLRFVAWGLEFRDDAYLMKRARAAVYPKTWMRNAFRVHDFGGLRV